MGRSDSKPTIRILILGAAGVGKNCLESQFTTATYPPLYDPALTLSSRRYLTLSPRPSSPPEPTTRPLDTSHGVPVLRQPSFENEGLGAEEDSSGEQDDRPRTASSTFSNPASLRRDDERGALPPAAEKATTATMSHLSSSEHQERTSTTASNKVTHRSPRTHHSDVQIAPKEPVSHPPPPTQACPDCQRDARTYLVELTNYPALQLRKVRAAVLAGGEYDAVLLVYDVGSRASFDAVAGLAGEIPLGRGRRKKKQTMMVRTRRGSTGEGSNATGGDGVGVNGRVAAGEKAGRTRLKRRRSSTVVGVDGRADAVAGPDGVANGGTDSRASISLGFRSGLHRGYGTGEPVVALVGNKADFDAEYASIDFGLEAKRAALEEVGVEERGLMHPLFRESQLYRDDYDGRGAVGVAVGGGLLPNPTISPSRPNAARKDTFASASSMRPLISPRSGRSFALDGQAHERLVPGGNSNGEVDEWPLAKNIDESYGIQVDKRDIEDSSAKVAANIAKATTVRTHINHTNIDSVVRRSAISANYPLIPNNRTSVLSRRSVRTMQEGSKPLVLTKLPKSEAIENWILTGSPTTAEHAEGEDLHGGDNSDGMPETDHVKYQPHVAVKARDRSYSTTTTTASKREVSRLEGEMLARALLLNVPFCETSAKTGENVEEMFEAVVREVLREQGRDAVPNTAAVYAGCRRKHGAGTGSDQRRSAAKAPANDGPVLFKGKGRKRSADRASWPEFVLPDPSADDRTRLVGDSELLETAVDANEAEGPVSPQRVEHRRRRESMLDRFRNVFARKSVAMVEDLAS